MISVFLGHDLEDDNENHVLQRLCRDLAKREVSAKIFANFHTTHRRNQRQIDLLVLTEGRLTLVELKCLAQRAPLLQGGVNNHWRQQFPDGTVRELEVNPVEQARQAAYAVGDVMRDLSKTGEVPPPVGGKFVKHIDTVVAVYPDLPPGSRLGRADHVTVVGYEQLLERLLAPGPRPHWSEANWDSLIRRLDLRHLDAGEDDPTLVREQHILEDYRRSLISSVSAQLDDLVTPSAHVNGEPVETLDLASYARHAQLVELLGRSGAGKSHTVRHAALRLSEAGHLVLWARCGDESTARLSAMLARAAAPHSTEKALTLVDTAVAHGRDAVLVLDGLNECSASRRSSLLSDLAALRRRHQVTVIITSTEPTPVPADDTMVSVELLAPDATQRAALLASYGAGDRPHEYADAFTTPFELSMAAACARDLPPEATRAALYRAFVRTRCPSTAARTVLRAAARLLDEQISNTVLLDALLDHLERAPAQRFDAAAIDAALASPLLIVEHGRVRFSHELLGRFMAAVELVHRPLGGAELAALLDQPRHHDLVEFTVDLDTEPAHRYALVTQLGRDEPLRHGLAGDYGTEVANRLRADVHAAFADATALTAGARLEVDGPDAVCGRWHLPAELSTSTARLIAAAIADLGAGDFLGELAELLEATDRTGDTVIEELRAKEFAGPVSLFVASAYGFGYQPSAPFPAQLVTDVLDHAKFRRLRNPDRHALAAALWTSGRRRGRGLMYVALELVDATLAEDRAVLMDLLETAWHAQGYHLRLIALNTIQRMPRDLTEHDPALYESVREFLEATPDAGNLMLNGLFIECLGGYGLVEPQVSAADLLRQIEAIVGAEPAPEMDELAYGVWSGQFEDEVIVGPVYEVLHELPRATRARLLTMAVRGRPEFGWFGASLISDLADAADPTDRDAIAALAARAVTLSDDTTFRQDAVGFHTEAVTALARFVAALPPADDTLPRVWRLVDELLHAAARHSRGPAIDVDVDVAAMDQWDELGADHAAAAIDVLHSLAHAMSASGPGHETSPYSLLHGAAPGRLRLLLEWGLAHPDRLTEPSTFRGEPGGLLRFVMAELGSLGDESTAAALEAWIADPEPGLAKIAVDGIRRLRAMGPDGGF